MPARQQKQPSQAEKQRAKDLAWYQDKVLHNKLFREYRIPFDYEQPPGLNNTGPYRWQIEFHNASADNPERMAMAANQVGKTTAGAAEVAMHATGLYPEWYKGRRFKHPVRIWCGSKSNEKSRDVIQKALLGPVGEEGTGWVPRDLIVGKPQGRQAGIPNVVDSFAVQHKSGGLSNIGLKTYEQHVVTWQGETLDVVWLDEEPPSEIFSECQTRLLVRKGILSVTVTPMEGHSDVVVHFLEPKTSGIYMINVTWDDAPHIGAAEAERLWNAYPEHEREARATGKPMMGTGAVFPIADEKIMCDPFPIPDHYFRIIGIDFGDDHPAADVALAWDMDTDTMYVYHAAKQAGMTSLTHSDRIKHLGDWIPVAWPKDGLNRARGSGEGGANSLRNQYRDHGVNMLSSFAAYPDERQNSVDQGNNEILEWMQSGRFKVFRTLTDWFNEKRLYHKKDGKVVRVRDDIMSATRYAFVMRRKAMSKLIAQGPSRSYAPQRPIMGRSSWQS